MVEPHIEPNRRIEGAKLIDTEPSQFLVKELTVRCRKVPVFDAPIGNRSRDTMDELLHRVLSLTLLLRVAIKILRTDDFGRQLGPTFGNFNVLLFEKSFPRIVRDFGGALVPFDFIKRWNLRSTEDSLNL